MTIIGVLAMRVFPPGGSALGQAVISGEFVPSQIDFGHAEDIHLTFSNLFPDCAIFRVAADLR